MGIREWFQGRKQKRTDRLARDEARWQQLHKQVLPMQRTTWIPVTEARDGEPTGSRFGGHPWLPRGEAWPRCAAGRHDLMFMLQLRRGELPSEARACFPEDLFQVFWCRECFDDPELRLRTLGEGGVAHRADGKHWPARRITGWTARDDFPMADDIPVERFKWSDDDQTLYVEHGEAHPECGTHEGDKLFGWPAWIQSEQWSDCVVCGERMALVLQIASTHNIPENFGDGGMFHVFRCPRHLDQFGFAHQFH